MDDNVEKLALGLNRKKFRLDRTVKAMRKLTLYRDDSTTQVVYENVKHFFWCASNTMLVIAQITDATTGAHRYIHWPRERLCWFKDESQPPAQEKESQ